MAFPIVTPRIAFQSNPLDATPVWTDVSNTVAGNYRLRSARIRRGRSHERARMDPGEMTLVLRNDDGAFDAWNTASPYYGNLLSYEQSIFHTGWANQSNTTVTLGTMTSIAAGDMTAETPRGTSGIPVIAGKVYAAFAEFESSGTGRVVGVDIGWFNAAGTFLSASTGSTVFDGAGVYTQTPTFSATAPANAAYANVVTRVTATGGAGEAHNVRNVSLNGGTSMVWGEGGRGGNIQPRAKIQLRAVWNMLTQGQGIFNSGWAAQSGGNCSVGVGTMTSSASGNMSAETPRGTAGIPVVPGKQYSAFGQFNAATNGRNVRVDVGWFNSAGTFISASTGGTATDSTGGGVWVQTSDVVVTAPSTAAYANLVAYVLSTGGASEVHNLRNFGLFPAAHVTVWSAGGGYDLFTGYIESIKPVWTTDRYGEVEITAVDGFTILGRTKLVDTAHFDAVMSFTPDGFWRLGEAGVANAVNGLFEALDSSGNAFDGTHKNSVSFGKDGALPTEANTAVDYGARTGWTELPSGACPSGTGDWTIACWVFPRSFQQNTPKDRIWHVESVGLQSLYLVVMSDGTLNFVAKDPNGGTLPSDTPLTLGRWNHVVAVKKGTTGPANWELYIDGVNVSDHGSETTDGGGNVSLTSNPILVGGYEVSGIGQGAFDGLVDEFAVFPDDLTSGNVTTLFDAAHTLTAPSLAGDRIDALLDLAGWPAADRDLDAGQFLMRPVTESLTSTFLLPYLLDLVDAEGYPAALFMDGSGSVVFQDRAHATPSSSATFGDAGGELALIRRVSPPIRDDANLWTSITGQSADGQPQTDTDATASTRYGPSSPPSLNNLQNNDDADVATLIADLLARYSTPADRAESFVVLPQKDPSNLYPLALGLDINGRILFNRHTLPGSGTALTLDQRIEGVEHTIAPGTWETTWRTVPT